MIRKVAGLILAGVTVFGPVACGGDDAGTVARDSDATTSTTAMSHGHSDAHDANPCAEGESGTLPGQTSTAPADGATAVTITAVDYAFNGTDALAAGGQFAITFENKGTELHELVIQHINDDETRPLAELLKDDDPSKFATPVIATFACPGRHADTIGADLSAKGRYIAVCFIPTGTLPSTKPSDSAKGGAPHAVNGMYAEVTVR